METFVVYQNPKDYPGKFVVRIQHATASGVVAGDLVAIGDSLEEVRAHIPPHLVCFTRHPDDDSAIVETWL